MSLKVHQQISKCQVSQRLVEIDGNCLGHTEQSFLRGGQYKVLSEVEGHPKEQKVGFKGRPGPRYYENIVAHLNDGTPLLVTPESARRVIAIMDLAEKSAKTHQSETIPYEFE